MPDIEVGTNSYISLEDANVFFEARLHADVWHEANPVDQQAALIMATRAIDRLILIGRPVDSEQELAFPRAGFGWEQESVPQTVRDAVCEEALALLDKDGELRYKLRMYGVTSATIGNVREGFANRAAPSGAPVAPNTLRSLEARHLMRPHIAGSVAIR